MTTTFTHWRRSEAALFTTDTPPQELQNSAWLSAAWRVLHALQAGRMSDVHACKDTIPASFRDLHTVLRVCTEGPFCSVDLDPQDLPVAERLLTAFANAVSGREWRDPELWKLAGYRPALLAAATLLTDERSAVYANPILDDTFPRASELQQLARAVQLLGTVPVALGRALQRVRLPRTPTPHCAPVFHDWAHSQDAWDTPHEEALRGLTSDTERHAVMVAVGSRLRRDVGMGRIHGLTRPSLVAWHLARHLGDERRIHVFGRLALGLSRHDRSVACPHDVTTAWLYTHAAEQVSPPPLAWSRQLAASTHPDLPQGLILDALATEILRLPDELAGRRLLSRGLSFPPSAWITCLKEKGISKPRLKGLMALHAAACGQWRVAMMAIEPLLQAGHTTVVKQLLNVLALAQRDGTLVAIPEDVPAVLRRHCRDPEVWWAWFGEEDAVACADAAERDVLAEVVDAAPTEPAHFASLLRLTLALRRPVGPLLRRVARGLRRRSTEESEAWALAAISEFYADTPPDGALASALWPLERFLDRPGSALHRLAHHASAFEGAVLLGATKWWLRQSKAHATRDAWTPVLARLFAVPQTLTSAFEHLIASLDFRTLRTLAQVGEAIRTGLSAPHQEERPMLVMPMGLLATPLFIPDDVPKVHIDADARRTPDPWKTLGLPHGAFDPDRIQQAWRQSVLAHPPERDSAQARLYLEARDRLLDLNERESLILGELPLPPPAGAFDEHLDLECTLLAQSVVHALIEDHLWDHGAAEAVAASADRHRSPHST